MSKIHSDLDLNTMAAAIDNYGDSDKFKKL